MPVSLTEQIILLVDDEESSRAMVRQMLRRIGFGEVLTAADGYRAIDILNQHPVNAVLTDFRMPGMHGLQLLKAIRMGKTKADRNLPCAMLTSYAERHLVGLAIILDVDTFLAKPVGLEVLTKHMGRMFQYRFEPQDLVHYSTVDVDNVAPHLTNAASEPPPETLTQAEAPPEPLPWDDAELAERAAEKAHQAVENAARTSKPDARADAPAKPASADNPVAASDGAPREASAVRVTLADVPEDAILARDLVGAGGTLLLAAGTPFKRRYMKRLEELSAISEAVEHVWIIDPLGAA